MSGIVCAVYGAGAGAGAGAIQNPLSAGSFIAVNSGATASATVTINNDGTLAVTGTVLTTVNSNWFSPTTASIGGSYYAKCVQSGTATGSGSAFGTVQTLGAGLSWTGTGLAGTSRFKQFVITIYSDALGVNQVSTGTYNFTLDGT